MEGWLSKRAGLTGTKWERRYCLLTADSVQYYMAKVKGQMPLAGCKVIREMGPGGGSKRATATPGQLTSQLQAMMQSQGILGDGVKLDRQYSLTQSQTDRYWPFSVMYDRDKKFEVAAETEDDFLRWTSAFESYATGKTASDAVELEGWLLKRDPTTKQMRRRYIVILQGKCWYFECIHKGDVEITNATTSFETKEVAATEPKYGTTHTVPSPLCAVV
jgi:hypothetical protein